MEKTDIFLFSVINNTSLRSKWLDFLMLALTQLGEGWVVLLVMTGIYYGLGLAGSWYAQSFVTALAAGVICQIVKKYFPRSRPVRVLPNVHVVGQKLTAGSFPSGHTATSFALAVIFSQHWPDLTYLLFITAGLIGLTRVYVGVHFPFDVFGGAVIGLSAASAIKAFLLAASGYGIQDPVTVVFGATFIAALALPLFGGYTFAKMYEEFKREVIRIKALLQGS